MTLVRQPRRRGAWRATLSATAFVCALSAAPETVAGAEPQALTTEERGQLGRGERIERVFSIELRGERYAAGISYMVVSAKPREILAELRKPGALLKAIPYTQEATTLSDDGRRSKIFVKQGLGPLGGSYTMLLEWDAVQPGGRFWLDPSAPHDLRDIWGYFRFQPWGPEQTLVSFALAFDLYAAVSLFEGPILSAALATPENLARLFPR